MLLRLLAWPGRGAKVRGGVSRGNWRRNVQPLEVDWLRIIAPVAPEQA